MIGEPTVKTVWNLNGFIVNRQPSKKVIFYGQFRQKCEVNINRQNVSKYFNSNFTISADLHGILAPKEFLNWKNQFLCSQKHTFLTLKLTFLISENISKFCKWKARATSKTHQLILIHTEVNIYVNLWTNFPHNNRQPSKNLKCNRQPSKPPPPHWHPHLC